MTLRKIISDSTNEYKSKDELRKQLNSLRIDSFMKPDNLITIDSLQRVEFKLEELPPQPADKVFLNLDKDSKLEFYRVTFNSTQEKINSFIEKLKQQYFYGFKQGNEKQDEFSFQSFIAEVLGESQYNFYDKQWEETATKLSESDKENVIYDYSYENYITDDTLNLISTILISYPQNQAEEIINNLSISQEKKQQVLSSYKNKLLLPADEKNSILELTKTTVTSKEIYCDYKEQNNLTNPFHILFNMNKQKEDFLQLYKSWSLSVNKEQILKNFLSSNVSSKSTIYDDLKTTDIISYNDNFNSNVGTFFSNKKLNSNPLYKLANKANVDSTINKNYRKFSDIFKGNLAYNENIGYIITKKKSGKVLKTVFIETQKEVVQYMDQQVPYFYGYDYIIEQCDLVLGNKLEYVDRLFPLKTTLTDAEAQKLLKIKQYISITALYTLDLLGNYKTDGMIDLDKINTFIGSPQFKQYYNYFSINNSLGPKQLTFGLNKEDMNLDVLSLLTVISGNSENSIAQGKFGANLYYDLIEDYFAQTPGIFKYSKKYNEETNQTDFFLILDVSQNTFNLWKLIEEGKTQQEILSQNDSFGLEKNNSYYPRLYDNHIDFCVINTPTIRLIKHKIYSANNLLVQTKPPIYPSIEVVAYKNINNKIKFNFFGLSGDLKQQSIKLNYQPYIDQLSSRKKDIDGMTVFNNDEPIDNILIFRTEIEPKSYEDFKYYDITKYLNGSYVETIQPNKKYWYCFVSQDIPGHDLYSNPSEIYQVEILSEKGLCYPVVQLYNFQKEKVSNVFYFKNNFNLYPNQSNVIPTEDQNGNTIWKDNNLFSKKFKFRIRSLATNRTIDINVVVNKTLTK
jgi:hypothetical protein